MSRPVISPMCRGPPGSRLTLVDPSTPRRVRRAVIDHPRTAPGTPFPSHRGRHARPDRRLPDRCHQRSGRQSLRAWPGTHHGEPGRQPRPVRHRPAERVLAQRLRLRRRRHLLPDQHRRGHLRRRRHLPRLHRDLVQHQLARAADRLARLRGHRHRDQLGARPARLPGRPAARGAVDYLTRSSSVRSRIDASRLAVAGHSMGGGGSLEAAKDRPSLQAAVPLAPWNLTKSWSSVRVPTLIIGGESDTVAPVSSHSIPFYTSIPPASEKAYLELNNASHFFPQTTNTPTGRQMVAWLKRFVDDDTRYDQFLCPGPSSSAISDYRDTCPLS